MINQPSLGAVSAATAAPEPRSSLPQEKKTNSPLVCTFATNMDIYVW